MKRFLPLLFLLLCGCSSQEKFRYDVSELEEGIYLFTANKNTNWYRASSMVAFKREMDELTKNKNVKIKNWHILENESKENHNVATVIIVFTEGDEHGCCGNNR